jgi:hypothetical protein
LDSGEQFELQASSIRSIPNEGRNGRPSNLRLKAVVMRLADPPPHAAIEQRSHEATERFLRVFGI